MVFPKARLVVSAGLFLAWIGFLVYLVERTRDPVILSRPQLDVSGLVVLAEVEARDGRPLNSVAVKRVAWAKAESDYKLAGSKITVDGLADCHKEQGWAGTGTYILPLSRLEGKETFEVTTLPLSPGYSPAYVTVKDTGSVRYNVPKAEVDESRKKMETAKAVLVTTGGESRIYPATADALKQLDEIPWPTRK